MVLSLQDFPKVFALEWLWVDAQVSTGFWRLISNWKECFTKRLSWASILVCELSCSTSEVIYEARRFKDLLIGVKHFTTYGLRPYILRGRSLGFLATCFSKVRVALCAWWRDEQAGLGGALAWDCHLHIFCHKYTVSFFAKIVVLLSDQCKKMWGLQKRKSLSGKKEWGA